MTETSVCMHKQLHLAPPGAGARLLAESMCRAADIGYALTALPLEPSYHRHAGFVPPRTEERQERTPFAAGIPFVLKGLGQEHEALAQNLAPLLIIYTHAESLL